jgi:hypothetical protein
MGLAKILAIPKNSYSSFMKIDHLITLSILLLLSLCNVRAQITEVANVTFQVVYLCEQQYSYPEEFQWNLSIGDTLCNHKNLNYSLIAKSVDDAISVVNASIEYGDDHNLNHDSISPCPKPIYRKVRNPNFNITYDGTWLVFERFISYPMTPSELNEARDQIARDSKKTFQKLYYSCTRSGKVASFTYVNSLTTDKAIIDINSTDVINICETSEKRFGIQGYDLIMFFNDLTNANYWSLYPPPEQDVCILSTSGNIHDITTYPMSDYLKIRDITNLDYNHVAPSSKWVFTNNISELRHSLRTSYDDTIQNSTIENLIRFINNNPQDAEIKMLRGDMHKMENYANSLNSSRSHSALISNLTNSYFESFYEFCLDLKVNSDNDVLSLETEFSSKRSDIKSRYDTIILYTQTSALQHMINQSADQFNKTIVESNKQFKTATDTAWASLIISIFSFGVSILSLWMTKRSNDELKTSIALLEIEIGNLSKSIRSISRPHICFLEGLFKRIFNR